MSNLVLNYLEEIVKIYPNKIAFVDNEREITFCELQREAYKIAAFLIKKEIFKKPILIFLEKSVSCIISFIGVAYSGNFYSPIDIKMPTSRIEKVLNTLKPAVIITDVKYRNSVEKLSDGVKVITVEDIFNISDVNPGIIINNMKKIIDTDILYVLFTSGSTGIPKGVIISHKSVVDFTDWISETYDFNEHTILGNQAQLYFDLSIQDVYAPLKTGATTVLIPNRFFAQPVRVWNIILKHKINTLVWIPSMLSMFANLDILKNVERASIEKVLFCGEVMPTKQLNYWIKNYPQAIYANLYGPTECTEACTYYTLDRKFSDEDILPMGIACENSEAFIVDDNGNIVTEQGIVGELYMRGTCLSLGYYNNSEKTREVFIQNPLNPNYPELVYKTGDLVRYNEYHELVYVSRKDFQIKHRGYRIELGDIDAAAISIPNVKYACCVFDNKLDKLILAYEGNIGIEEVRLQLISRLQEYMVPVEYRKMDAMLFNINGKIDRRAIELMFCCTIKDGK